MNSSSARAVAGEVLGRVWADAAYAAPTLDAELTRAALDDRDRRLATELVYGVLRTQAYLEARIARHADNDRWKKKPRVRGALLMAAYGLMFLRIPAHAAVSEAVGAIKGSADRKVAGFANAVLRKLAGEANELTLEQATAASLPRWLQSRLEVALGADGAAAFVTGVGAPSLGLCLRAGVDRDACIETLRAAAPQARFEPGALSPRCIRVQGAGDPRRLPGSEQAFAVQEEGAQVVALALGARPGDEVLDACAGRGGKAILLAEEVGAGAVDAADLHVDKLTELQARAGGRGVRAVYGVDWTRGSGAVTQRYDRVLVDAPCSGTGTLRRRPEIAGRLGASDVTRLAALQLQIARAAALHVKDGGRLVYAVCSLLREECEGIVEALSVGGLTPAPFDAPLPFLQGQTQLRLLPHVHGTDGYFIASFKR